MQMQADMAAENVRCIQAQAGSARFSFVSSVLFHTLTPRQVDSLEWHTSSSVWCSAVREECSRYWSIST